MDVLSKNIRESHSLGQIPKYTCDHFVEPSRESSKLYVNVMGTPGVIEGCRECILSIVLSYIKMNAITCLNCYKMLTNKTIHTLQDNQLNQYLLCSAECRSWEPYVFTKCPHVAFGYISENLSEPTQLYMGSNGKRLMRRTCATCSMIYPLDDDLRFRCFSCDANISSTEAKSFTNMKTNTAYIVCSEKCITDVIERTTSHLCKVCGLYSTSRCSSCKSAKYCSRACQTQDWPIHKKECQTEN